MTAETHAGQSNSLPDQAPPLQRQTTQGRKVDPQDPEDRMLYTGSPPDSPNAGMLHDAYMPGGSAAHAAGATGGVRGGYGYGFDHGPAAADHRPTVRAGYLNMRDGPGHRRHKNSQITGLGDLADQLGSGDVPNDLLGAFQQMELRNARAAGSYGTMRTDSQGRAQPSQRLRWGQHRAGRGVRAPASASVVEQRRAARAARAAAAKATAPASARYMNESKSNIRAQLERQAQQRKKSAASVQAQAKASNPTYMHNEQMLNMLRTAPLVHQAGGAGVRTWGIDDYEDYEDYEDY